MVHITALDIIPDGFVNLEVGGMVANCLFV